MADLTLSIPKLNLRAPILDISLAGDSWDVSALDTSVGHLEGTGAFNTPDNFVLTGNAVNSDGDAGVFAHLHTLAAGDEIVVRVADGGDRRYTVGVVRRVGHTDFSVLDAHGKEQLTLISVVVDSYSDAESDYLERHIVIASPVAVAAPAAAPDNTKATAEAEAVEDETAELRAAVVDGVQDDISEAVFSW